MNTLPRTPDGAELPELRAPRRQAALCFAVTLLVYPSLVPRFVRYSSPPTRHLAFGGGPHYCLGYHLAQLEARAAIGTLVSRFRDLRLKSETVDWSRSRFRVPDRVPISFRASS